MTQEVKNIDIIDLNDFPAGEKVRYIYLKQVPLECVFRYKERFYKKITHGRAFCLDEMGVLELHSGNQYEGVAISIEDHEEELT